jgi:hypothetical protein
MVESSIHEVGHNLGLRHTFEDPKVAGEPRNNYMSYERKEHLIFNGTQIKSVYQAAQKGQFNHGSNYTTNYTPNNTNNGQTTNEKPFRGIINSGQKMPAILSND